MSTSRFVRAVVVFMALIASFTLTTVSPAVAKSRPTIVLVHGAFADTTSWDSVAAGLRGRGYNVVVPDNPLRGPAYDSSAIESVLAGIAGPIVLVGHSYGGAVITNIHNANVRANVYIAAFAPADGEPVQALLDPLRFPGSRALPPALELRVVDDPQAVGGKNVDGFIAREYFHEIFTQDVDPATADAMFAHQRSAALWANLQPTTDPSWATTPSWYLVSDSDRVIPPAAQRFMAARSGAHTAEISASHASLVSRPGPVTETIVNAASAIGG